jgi:hypothetical protein
MAPADETKDSDPVPFPAGLPKPHEIEKWTRSIRKQCTDRGIAEIPLGTIPEGKFQYIYPSSMLKSTIKEPKRDAPAKEFMAWERHQDELRKRQLHNEHVALQKEEWRAIGNDTYFTIVTESMAITQPGLRTQLRKECALPDGRYDGVGAVETVAAWLAQNNINFPQEDFYDDAAAALKKKTLPAGTSEKVFESIARILSTT